MPLPADTNAITSNEAGGETAPFEEVLGEALREFLLELTMINGAVLVSYICRDQHASLDDIVASSAECVLKPGRMRYAHHAEIDFDWGRSPTVMLALELQTAEVTTFFRVLMAGSHVGIEIDGIHFSDGLQGREDNLETYAAAVFGARLAPPPALVRPGKEAVSLGQDTSPILPP